MNSHAGHGHGGRPTHEPGAPRDTQVVEREFFNGLVAAEGDFNPFADRGWRTINAVFRGFLDRPPPVSVLDIGAGTGRSRQIYIGVASRYVGVDIAEEAVACARRRHPESEWVVADACDLAFPDAAFDVVAFSSVLHHIPRFDLALREAVRVLKPGGGVFAFDPNLLHPAMALFRWPKSPLYSPVGVSPNESPMLPGVLRRGFEAAGLVRVRQRCRSGIPYRAVAPRVFSRGLAAFNACDALWQACGLGRWFGTFVFTYGEKPS